jgi:hypothetical protein
MIYYSNIPDGAWYVHVDNGRFQPRLTLAEIREFLETSGTHRDGDPDWSRGNRCPTCWGAYAVRDVLRVPK